MITSILHTLGIAGSIGLFVLLWLLPFLLILGSRRARGGEKLAWILAVVFISWFAWVFFLLLAPISKR